MVGLVPWIRPLLVVLLCVSVCVVTQLNSISTIYQLYDRNLGLRSAVMRDGMLTR